MKQASQPVLRELVHCSSMQKYLIDLVCGHCELGMIFSIIETVKVDLEIV